MFSISNVDDLYKLFDKFEYPIAWAMATVLTLFLIWRKFTTTEYITAGKAAFESLNQLCDQLQEENKHVVIEMKLINEQLDQCLITNKKMKEDFEDLKNKINLTKT